jgi:signal transduction histidine kinase
MPYGGVLLSVAETGEGIPPKRPAARKLLSQRSLTPGGTRIRVKSSLDAGAQFTVALRLA